MFNLTRRVFGLGLLAASVAMSFDAAAQELKQFSIGYQKTGLPVIARQQQVIEKALADKGVTVKWVEFTAGPPLVEALNVGAIDVGWTGDAPPIFGQSAGANIVYVAALPSNGDGEAIFVKPASPIQSVADLKGKTRRRRQGHQRAQPSRRRPGKGRHPLRPDHAGLSQPG